MNRRPDRASRERSSREPPRAIRARSVLLTPNIGTHPWMVDGHGHLHPWMSRDRAFHLAHANFRRICQEEGLPGDTPKIIALVDPRGYDSRTMLEAPSLPGRQQGAEAEGRSGAGLHDPWQVRPLSDRLSFRATRPSDEAELFLVLGRQLRARCGLEVLAPATTTLQVPDGLPFPEAVAAVRQEVGYAILPWGVGKWTFGRGRKVAETLREDAEGRTLIGDNAGRPPYLPPPRLFRMAEGSGIPILPGSDPLPLSGEERKLGSFGFVLQGGFDKEAPGASLRRALLDLDSPPRRVGRREGLAPFLRSQLRLQSRRFRSLVGGPEDARSGP